MLIKLVYRKHARCDFTDTHSDRDQFRVEEQRVHIMKAAIINIHVNLGGIIIAIVVAGLGNYGVFGNESIVFPGHVDERAAFRHLLPTPDEGCGKFVISSRVKTPIVYRSNEGFLPFVVQLGYGSSIDVTSNNLQWLCTGTLITAHHVLTAASCITESLQIIRLGQRDRLDPYAALVDLPVANTTVHPYYTSAPNLRHDIAVVRLHQSALQISPTASTICLPLTEPLRSKNYTGHTPFVVGWWSLRPDLDDAHQLLDRQHTVLHSCQRQQPHGAFVPTPGLICTDNFASDWGPCIEFGAPLVQPERMHNSFDYRMYQTGIGSFGLNCAFDQDSNAQLGYTRVQDYVEWIAAVL